MNYEIRYKPSFSLLVVTLSPGEKITAEAGAMTYMHPSITVSTRKREKSLLGSIGLSLFGEQSFFVTDYTAGNEPAEAAFSAAPLGDVDPIKIAPGIGYIVQKASYLAATEGVKLDMKWEGFTKGLFGQGLLMIKVSGEGTLFINTFGAIDKHLLKDGEKMIVDNFHLVAFSDTCHYRVTKFGGLKETLFSGEGLVTEITGPGEIYIQTKNVRELADMIWSIIEPRVQAKSR